jgi:hypothetical protein
VLSFLLYYFTRLHKQFAITVLSRRLHKDTFYFFFYLLHHSQDYKYILVFTMMFRSFSLLALAGPALGHWVLNMPTSFGFDDVTESMAPCGGSDTTNRSVVTEWPVSGYPVSGLTAHATGVWTFRAAVATDLTNFMTMQANVTQTGVGHVCYQSVPGMQMLVGKDSVVQIIVTGPDGPLYQVRLSRA